MIIICPPQSYANEQLDLKRSLFCQVVITLVTVRVKNPIPPTRRPTHYRHTTHTTKALANKLPKLPHKKRNFKSTPILKQYLIGKKSKSQPFWKRNTSTWVFSIFFKVRIPRELISRHTTDMLVRSADTLSTLPRNKRNSESLPILKHYPRVGGKVYLIGKEIWITAILKTKYKYLGLLDFFSK